ncbi:MAG: NB-ARC domain-containing protein, partial [Caldilineales bacterium]|nr:NB-ARC domain-containing protein [Caldilineales bacterium]
MGPPGVGKTALALALAHRKEVAAAFPDGRAWTALGPEPDLFGLLGRLLEQFGASGQDLTSVEARCDRLRSLLAGRRYLLVLDDVWQDGHARPFLQVVLPPARVLFTTRRAPKAEDLQAKLFDVRRLKSQDAVAMLADAGAGARAGVDADPQGAAALAEAVGYLPLALHVVGRRLNALARALGPPRAVETLRASLDRELLTLRAAAPRPGVEEPEPSLEAAIALSYRALPDDGMRQAFRRLAVFGGQPLDFDLAAAAAVWGVDAAAAVTTMVALVGEGLVETGREEAEEDGRASAEGAGETPLRFRLHQVIVRFAEAQLAADPAEARAARLAHARYYAAVVAGYDDAIRQGRMRYSAPLEWEQVAQALERLSGEASRDDEAARVLVAYSRHWRNVLVNNHDPRRWRWLEAAYQAAADVGGDWDRANVLQAQGDVLAFQKRNDEALARYEQALGLYRAVGDRLGEAHVLLAQGDVLAFQKRNEEALACYEQALGLYRAVGARLGEANVLQAQGDVLAFLDRREEALACYEQALGLYRAVGDRLGEANVL